MISIMEKAKEYVMKNVLCYAILKDIFLLFYLPRWKQINIVKRLSKIDTILEFDIFKSEIEHIKQHKEITMLRFDKYGAESKTRYGYYSELMKYAGMTDKGFVYISAMEHGVRFSSLPWIDNPQKLMSNICFACQGAGRINELHKLDPWKPVFVLGPYIHYASQYYSDEKVLQIKNKLGKTLLVFPSHSWEYGEKKTENSLFDIVYQKYANNYDTVLVCAYWNDIDAPIIDLFAQNDAKIVSAGFRNDPNFIQRLKTIISLADDVVVDDIGTNIGFCKYMNKPVYLESSYSRFPNDKYYTENFNRFHDAFFTQDKIFTEIQYQQQDKLYEFFWGGEKYLKTPEEVRAIINVLKKMCISTYYNINSMPNFIQKNCPIHSSELEYSLLADSVALSVWK